MNRLAGKTAIVTGGAVGIGRAGCDDGAGSIASDRSAAKGNAAGLRRQCSICQRHVARAAVVGIRSEVDVASAGNANVGIDVDVVVGLQSNAVACIHGERGVDSDVVAGLKVKLGKTSD